MRLPRNNFSLIDEHSTARHRLPPRSRHRQECSATYAKLERHALHRMAALQMLAELECRNTGKPIVERSMTSPTWQRFRILRGLATKVVGYVNPVPDNAMSLSLKEPMGSRADYSVDYPLMMAAWKLAPALAAGCTCVLKPAEQTPLTALELARWFDESACRRRSERGYRFWRKLRVALVKHPDVNKIAFTGSASSAKSS